MIYSSKYMKSRIFMILIIFYSYEEYILSSNLRLLKRFETFHKIYWKLPKKSNHQLILRRKVWSWSIRIHYSWIIFILNNLFVICLNGTVRMHYNSCDGSGFYFLFLNFPDKSLIKAFLQFSRKLVNPHDIKALFTELSVQSIKQKQSWGTFHEHLKHKESNHWCSKENHDNTEGPKRSTYTSQKNTSDQSRNDTDCKNSSNVNNIRAESKFTESTLRIIKDKRSDNFCTVHQTMTCKTAHNDSIIIDNLNYSFNGSEAASDYAMSKRSDKTYRCILSIFEPC